MRIFLLSSASVLFLLACGGSETTADGGGGDGGMMMMGTDGSMMGMDSSMTGDTGGGDSSMMNDAGLPPSNPKQVDCGNMTCMAGQQVCCVSGGGMMGDGGAQYSCIAPMATCQGARIGCDEAADCNMGEICCGGLQGMSFAVRCTSMGCGNGVQVCKTSQECGDAGTCQTYTCPFIGKVTACRKPFMACN